MWVPDDLINLPSAGLPNRAWDLEEAQELFCRVCDFYEIQSAVITITYRYLWLGQFDSDGGVAQLRFKPVMGDDQKWSFLRELLRRHVLLMCPTTFHIEAEMLRIHHEIIASK